jgi:hypothetical protein
MEKARFCGVRQLPVIVFCKVILLQNHHACPVAIQIIRILPICFCELPKPIARIEDIVVRCDQKIRKIIHRLQIGVIFLVRAIIQAAFDLKAPLLKPLYPGREPVHQ